MPEKSGDADLVEPRFRNRTYAEKLSIALVYKLILAILVGRTLLVAKLTYDDTNENGDFAAGNSKLITLQSCQEETARMWRFSRSNGITEGFHRKVKLIQRRAFGFRNLENYRKCVRALCA